MTRTSLMSACMGALVAVTVMATAAAAQKTSDEKTIFTFSGPVELPGRTLPAGKYIFRLADSLSNRHIVQVFDADGSRLLATILAIPTERMDPTDEPKIDFMETAENVPPAIQKWWYPGDTIGHEFIYPKEQAMRLAKASNRAVLMVDVAADDTRGMRDAPVVMIDPSGQSRTREESRTARVELPPTPPLPAPDVAVGTSGRTTAPARRSLPGTASNLPLIGLFGVMSLAAALTLRRFGLR